MRPLRNRLTYANVMATIAVFIALGGASYAAIKLPKNSVGAKQLKKGAVTPAKFSPAAKKIAGSAGPAGPKGETGPRGPSNAYAAFNNDQVTGATKSISLNVPAGSYVVSASMFALNEESKEARVSCDLLSPNDRTHQESGAVANLPKQPTETIYAYQQPEAQGVFTIGGSGGTITYECSKAEGPGKVTLYHAQIIATAVGSLSG